MEAFFYFIVYVLLESLTKGISFTSTMKEQCYYFKSGNLT